jgi:hypothetical protein
MAMRHNPWERDMTFDVGCTFNGEMWPLKEHFQLQYFTIKINK